MGAIAHQNIQWSSELITAVLVRELNTHLETISRIATLNFRVSYPQVDAVFTADATRSIWLPLEDYVVESISLKVSTGTGSVTPRINTVAMTVSGGTPIAVTTTAATTAVTALGVVTALDDVDFVVTGLTGVLVAAVKVRREG